MGKRTTTRHKEDNTFRFESQPAKIRKITLKTGAEIRTRVPLGDNANTSLFQILQINSEKNNSEDLLTLVADLDPHCRKLEQILHAKESIVSTLLIYLEGKGNPLSTSERDVLLDNTFEEATEFTIAVAQDIGKDLVKDLPTIVKTISQTLLENKTPKIIEAGFNCISQLSKILRRYDLERFDKYLKIISKFWIPKIQVDIINLSGESISLFARKKWKADIQGFFFCLNNLLKRLVEDSSLTPDAAVVAGVEGMLFHMIKWHKKSANWFGGDILKSCLKSEEIKDTSLEIWPVIMENVIRRVISNTSADRSEILKVIVGSKEDRISRRNLRLRLFNVFLKECPTFVETNQEDILESYNEFKNEMCDFDASVLESMSILFKHRWTHNTEIVGRSAESCPDVHLEALRKILTENNTPFRFYARCLLESYLCAIRFSEAIALAYEPPTSLIFQQEFLFIKFFSDAKFCSLLRSTDAEYAIHGGMPKTDFNDLCVTPIKLTCGSGPYKVAVTSCCKLTSYINSVEEGFESEAAPEDHIPFYMAFKDIGGWCEACIKSYLRSVHKFLEYFIAEAEEYHLSAENQERFLAVLVYAMQCPQRVEWDRRLPELLSKLLSKSDVHDTTVFSIWALKLLNEFLHSYDKSEGSPLHRALVMLSTGSHTGWKALMTNLNCGYRMVRLLTFDIISNWASVTKLDSNFKAIVSLCNESRKLDECEYKAPGFVNQVSSYLLGLGENLSWTEDRVIAFNYVLGLMHTNHKLVQEKCVQYLQKHISGFMREFKLTEKTLMSLGDIPIMTLLGGEPKVKDVMSLAKFVTFRLPGSQAWDDAEENIDGIQYRTNFFKACLGLTDNVEIRKEILKRTFDTFDTSEICQDMTVVPLLKFLSKSPPPKEGADRLYDIAINFLIAPNWLSTAVLEVLISLKREVLQQYAPVLKELQSKKNNESLLRLSMDSENPIVETRHRSVVIPIVSRILIQKCKGQKRQYRNAILRRVSTTPEPEILQYILLATNWRTHFETKGMKSVLYALGFYRSFMGIIGYKFPNLLVKLGELVCDVSKFLYEHEAQMIPSVGTHTAKTTRPNDDVECDIDEVEGAELIEEEASRKHTERAHTLIRTHVKELFANYSKLPFEESFLRRIFDEVVAPVLSDQPSVKTSTLDLLDVWSLNPRFHVFFSKMMAHGDQVKKTNPALYLFRTLCFCHKDKIRTRILQILLNLLDDDLPKGYEPLAMSADSFGLDFYPIDGVPIGEQLLLWGWRKYMAHFLREPSMLKEFCQNGNRKRIDLISKLAEVVDDAAWSESLCQQLLSMLQLYKADQDGFCKLLEAIKRALNFTKETNQDDLLMKLSPWFSKITERKTREALCDVFKSERNGDLSEIVLGLNSWEPGPGDTPSYIRRHSAHEKCRDLIRKGFDRVLYTIVAYNCFYTLHEVSDFGEHSNAIDTLEEISRQKPHQDLLSMKKLLETVILSEISKGIRHRDEKKFQGFIRTLNTFISNCKDMHGTLVELTFLSDQSESGISILDGLRDVKVHKRTRNMNRLSKALKDYDSNDKYISPSILLSYVMPLARHNLDNEKTLGDNRNELIDSSIDVVENILRLVPYKTYLKFLLTLLTTPLRHENLAKQKHRIIMAVMNAFNYDLSAATDDTSSMVENNGHGFEERRKLSPATALKCVEELSSSVIPKLQEFAKLENNFRHKHTEKESVETAQKFANKSPFIVCLAKLLGKMPEKYALEFKRPLIPKFCSFIQSKNYQVRQDNRKILSTLLREFGPASFLEMVSCLMAVLRRGYEKHVLSYTISFLMTENQELFVANSSAIPMYKVIKICEDERFGEMLSEKDVQAIKEKTPEARNDNAGPILELCAKVTTDRNVVEEMIKIPTKNLLEEFKFNDQMINSARHWVLAVRKGLAGNMSLSAEDILSFLLEKLNALSIEKSNSVERKATPKSIYEIASIKKSRPEYLHVDSILIEFTYDVLWNYLKRMELSSDICIAYGPRLLLGLDGETKTIECLSMKCLTAMIDLEVFDFEKHNTLLVSSWRKVILKMSKHCFAAASDQEMVNAIFKFITSFLQTYLIYKLEVDDYRLMLQSVKCFLTHESSSTPAINLLRKLIARKYRSSEIEDVMTEVRDKSIESGGDHIREGCRNAYMDFVRISNAKKVEETVNFYLDNLKYGEAPGRESAAIAVNLLIHCLPKGLYEDIFAKIFLSLVLAIDNELEQKVQIKLHETFKNLIGIESTSQKLLKVFCQIITADKKKSYHTYCKLIGIFLTTGDYSKLEEFISFYERVLSEISTNWSSDVDENKKKQKSAIDSILDGLTELVEAKHTAKIVDLIGLIRDQFLENDHLRIKLKSLKLVDTILRGINMEELMDLLRRKQPLLPACPLFEKLDGISQLIRKLSTILEKTYEPKVDEYVLEGLEALARIAVRLHEEGISSNFLRELMKNLRHLITTEVTQHPERFLLRKTAYRLYVTFIDQLNDIAILNNYAGIIIRHCVRDTTDPNTPAPVSHRAEEVMNALKTKIGSEQFLMIQAATQQLISTKRQENRAKKAENVILHPGIKRKRATSAGKQKGGGGKKPGEKKAKKRKTA